MESLFKIGFYICSMFSCGSVYFFNFFEDGSVYFVDTIVMSLRPVAASAFIFLLMIHMHHEMNVIEIFLNSLWQS